jgi:hypothetical protein
MNTPQWMHRQESVKIKTYKKNIGNQLQGYALQLIPDVLS